LLIAYTSFICKISQQKFTIDFMDKNMSAIRRARLKQLINSNYNSQIEFANAVNYEPSFISQLVNGQRNCGEKVARNIEKMTKLPTGYLDNYYTTQSKKIAFINETYDANRLIPLVRLQLNQLDNKLKNQDIDEKDVQLLHLFLNRLNFKI